MKYQVVYESQSGNTEQLAKAIASCFPENQVNLIDINLQTPSKKADIYCIGFGVRHSLCSMRLIDFLECLNNKTILLFATCGMNPSENYHRVLERNLEPFLPENCDYRGFYLCQGAISDEGYQSIRCRFEQNGDAETLERFEEFRIGIQDRPNQSDLENGKEYVRRALEL